MNYRPIEKDASEDKLKKQQKTGIELYMDRKTEGEVY